MTTIKIRGKCSPSRLPIITRNRFYDRRAYEDELDYMHRMAGAGLGLIEMKRRFPDFPIHNLRYWMETNEYKL